MLKTYALIHTESGEIRDRSAFVEGEQPRLALAKGLRWIPDNPPAFDARKESRGQISPVSVDAEEVPYETVPRPLDDVKADHIARLHAIFDGYGGALVSGYAPTERETWPEQAKAAEAYVADPGGDNSYLAAMTKAGETVADLAALILANRDALKAASGALIKVRREHEAAIDAAQSADAVLAVDINEGWL